MEILIMLLINAILTECLSYVNTLLEGLITVALHAEYSMGTLLGTNGFVSIFNIFFSFGISLIILKFLKKGFETYILWTDGDADGDPMLLITNFVKSLAIAIGFPTLYNLLCTIVEDLTNQLLNAVDTGMNTNFSAIIGAVSTGGIFTAIVTLIFFIIFFLLYIQFLMRGLEMLILRIGLPVACVGLLDSDKGVFKTYIQKFFQSAVSIIVQLVLAKLGVALMLNGHIFWAISSIMLALKTPKFLSEFIIISGGQSNGVTGTIYQTVRLVQIAKNAIK